LACPLFVPFVEEGEIKSNGLKETAREYLSKLKIKKIDTLVMGCTHYPIIEKLIAREVDNHVRIVDPGKSVAKEVFDFLSKNKMLNEQNSHGKKNFFVTDLTKRFTKVAEIFLGHKIEENLKKIIL